MNPLFERHKGKTLQLSPASVSPGVSASAGFTRGGKFHQVFHTYILVQVYLPVAFLGDRDPVD